MWRKLCLLTPKEATDPRKICVDAKFLFTEFKQTFGSEPRHIRTARLWRRRAAGQRLINDGERLRLGLAERMARLDRTPGILGSSSDDVPHVNWFGR